ncbi:MAG: MBL fold metallo-hydrolase [Clostridia bacterium]|nr:MBL fold metallo-hydrolase [Clostridia bacterium]
MNFIIGGGVHEHGRNCFYVEADVNYIVDCGVMKGVRNTYPKLPADKIAAAEYLFLTHSHEDHIGAFGWLLSKGFKGKVIASAKTLEAISGYDNVFALPDGGNSAIFGDLTVQYGRSGHCTGSLWYYIKTADSEILFSGDYCENSCYNVDKIQNYSADIAVLDCAFGYFGYNRAVQEMRISEFAESVLKTGNLLLPVPKNGRAVDLIYLLRNMDCNISVDEKLRLTFCELAKGDYWLPEDISAAVDKCLYRDVRYGKPTVFLIADAQLSSCEGRQAADSVIKSGGSVLFTGHADNGGEAYRLISCGAGKVIPYNAHMSKLDADYVAGRNKFEKIIYFHGDDKKQT